MIHTILQHILLITLPVQLLFQSPENLPQLGEIDRLQQIMCHMILHCLLGIRKILVGRQKYHLNGKVLLSYQACNLNPAYVGHFDIRQNHIRNIVFQIIQKLLSIVKLAIHPKSKLVPSDHIHKCPACGKFILSNYQ